MANDLPAGVKPHAFEATAAAARWLVTRARMGGAKILASRLRALRDVLEPFEGAKTLDAEEDVSALRAHAQVTAWLAGLSWAPYASSSATDDGGLLRASAAHLYATPVTSTWWASDGAVVLGGDEFATGDGHGQVEWSSRACEAMARNTDKDPLEVLIPDSGHHVTSVAFSPDGSRIASGIDTTVRVWNAASGERVATLEGHSGEVSSVAFSPDGSRIASGSEDKTVRIWDAATGECVAKLEGHSDYVTSVAFSPDGSRIASGSEDETVRVWNAASGECVATLKGHSNVVTSVAFSPDGSRIASGNRAKTVRVWDAATGECVAKLEGHPREVSSVAFSPDGSRIASGSDDRTVRVWNRLTREDLGDCDVTS
jgi:WD40 repeat protein